MKGGANRIRYARVAMPAGGADPIGQLAARIAEAAPELRRDAVVLVDSPRSPREGPQERDLDIALRATVTRLNLGRAPRRRIALSMFPTPEIEYFARCAADPGCKPHLKTLAISALGCEMPCESTRRKAGGWIFTRFMIAGFAVYRALELLGAAAHECYPYLVFSLAAPGPLPSKSRRRAALESRRRILARMSARSGISLAPPASLDQADAAVMAMAARGARAIVVLKSRASGSFLLPLIDGEAASAAIPRA